MRHKELIKMSDEKTESEPLNQEQLRNGSNSSKGKGARAMFSENSLIWQDYDYCDSSDEHDDDDGLLKNCRKERIMINVGGFRHETYLSTLLRIPYSRLGKLAQEYLERLKGQDGAGAEEYFFDRHPGVFHSIIDYYRTGELHCPLDICGGVINRELVFWGIDEKVEFCCISNYGSQKQRRVDFEEFYRVSTEVRANDGFKIDSETPSCSRKRWWNVLTAPHSSNLAMIYSIVSFIIVLSHITGFTIETMSFTEQWVNISEACGEIIPSHQKIRLPLPALRYFDFACAIFFTIELLLKFILSPSKVDFLRSGMTWVDFLALIPSYVQFIMFYTDVNHCAITFSRVINILEILRMLRIFRLFRIIRYYNPFRILIYSLKSSFKELFMLLTFLFVTVLFFGTLIFYVERENAYQNRSKYFPDLTAGFWWAIVTMTTVGYGDKVPQTSLGYLVGTLVVISGVVLITLAVPIISGNFARLYEFASARENLSKTFKRERSLSRSERLNKQYNRQSSYGTIHAIKTFINIDNRTANGDAINLVSCVEK